MIEHEVVYGVGKSFPEAIAEFDSRMCKYLANDFYVHGSVQHALFPDRFGEYSVCIYVLMIQNVLSNQKVDEE